MATAGEEWIAPEVRAARDEEQFILESEEIFAKELRERCVKKGLDCETELAAHQKAVAEKREKMLAKKADDERKAAEKKRLAEEKKAARLAAMTEEQRARKSERERLRAEREEAAWQKEKAKGEEFYHKIQAELAASTEKAR